MFIFIWLLFIFLIRVYKNHLFEFLSVRNEVRPDQLKVVSSSRSTRLSMNACHQGDSSGKKNHLNACNILYDEVLPT